MRSQILTSNVAYIWPVTAKKFLAFGNKVLNFGTKKVLWKKSPENEKSLGIKSRHFETVFLGLFVWFHDMNLYKNLRKKFYYSRKCMETKDI